MRTEFRKAVLAREMRSLILFDRKAFHEYPADWFDKEDWKACIPWWMLVEGRKVGCCAFAHAADFSESPQESGKRRSSDASLYIVSTGLLPEFRGMGLGQLMKQWQICYARRHGFTYIVTNSRQSNKAILSLNQKFGFRIVGTIPNYYERPAEAAIVMEFHLGEQGGRRT